MTSQQGGWSPAAKTALTLALVALFVVGSVATILLTMRKKDGATVPWAAGGGEQPTVVRGPGRSDVPLPKAPRREQAVEAPESGLAVVFARPGDEAQADARVARLLALSVRPGEAVSQGLPAGPFLATFSGALEVDLRDRYRFAFEGTGALTLEIEGKPVLVADLAAPGRVEGDRVRLNKGQNGIVARYRSPVDGEARLRVLWSSSEFAWERDSWC
jgi:hypothetical protein